MTERVEFTRRKTIKLRQRLILIFFCITILLVHLAGIGVLSLFVAVALLFYVLRIRSKYLNEPYLMVFKEDELSFFNRRNRLKAYLTINLRSFRGEFECDLILIRNRKNVIIMKSDWKDFDTIIDKLNAYNQLQKIEINKYKKVAGKADDFGGILTIIKDLFD